MKLDEFVLILKSNLKMSFGIKDYLENILWIKRRIPDYFTTAGDEWDNTMDHHWVKKKGKSIVKMRG